MYQLMHDSLTSRSRKRRLTKSLFFGSLDLGFLALFIYFLFGVEEDT